MKKEKVGVKFMQKAESVDPMKYTSVMFPLEGVVTATTNDKAHQSPH